MSKKLRILSPKVWLFGKIRLKKSFRSKNEEKSDSQDFFLKFNQIVILNVLPESNPKPEVQNPKWWVMKNPTRPETREKSTRLCPTM